MMSMELRIALFAAALFTLLTFMRRIRKNRLQIDYAVFWTLISVLLLVISVFPQVIAAFADVLGIQSPANLVYLSAIAVLLFRLFSITIKLSRMDQQIAALTQHIAIYEKDHAHTETDPHAGDSTAET